MTGEAKARTGAHRRDLTGQRFGRLVVVGPSDKRNAACKAVWHCRCDCGREVDIVSASLIRGLSRSCGCLNREKSAAMHEHMTYRDDTCVELLVSSQKDTGRNKVGFRGLFRTKSGAYRAAITFRKVHYTLGYFATFEEAVRARLDAEASLHAGYVAAFRRYESRAAEDPAWAGENPFVYDVKRTENGFSVYTNGN